MMDITPNEYKLYEENLKFWFYYMLRIWVGVAAKRERERERLKWGELRVCVLFNKRGKKSKLKKL